MKKIIKNSIIILLIGGATAGIYFGSYRPLIKGQKYIAAIGKRKEVTSVESFKKIFTPALHYKAPLSDDEIVKFISGDIVDMASSGKQPEEVIRELLAFIEKYTDKDDVIHLLNTARTYHFMWIQYGGKEEYFKKAEEGYMKVLTLAPKLPPVLYGILDLYRASGNAEKVKEYGERILRLWPEDKRVITLLQTIQKIEEQ
ncbi:MAG: hypothetical protein Q8R20_01300 [Nanoarchaeota archaeon]|nr:hypothetical protein [Nanoarchaeota archaeon]